MRVGPPRHVRDRDAVKGVVIDRRVLQRAWGFARPYRRQILGFLATIVASSLIGLLPPLLFRSIIDTAIPEGDRRLVVVLTTITVVAALASAFIGVLQRWGASVIGEGMIYDLRVALFDHVQRMPIAFFTRTQTGALISRMNNDVIGAQDAVTGTLGSVVSNVIVLATTLTTMLVLEWRLTLLALVVLPLFILPAKRVGRVLQAITRERMDLNAQMNTQMTERFNVAGAMLVKLFGRHDDEISEFSDRAGARARHRRPPGPVRPGVLRRARARGRRRHRRRLRRRGPARHLEHDLARHARRHGGLRDPHLRSAHRASPTPGSTS